MKAMREEKGKVVTGRPMKRKYCFAEKGAHAELRNVNVR